MQKDQIITLHHKDMTACVAPFLGANVFAFAKAGVPILRAPASLDALRAAPVLYGTPLLFPANRTADGTFFFEDVRYTLPINEPARNNNLHGALCTASFTVTSQSDDSVTCFFENKDRAIYPFCFSFTMRATLQDDGLHQHFIIRNTDTRRLPFTFGLHTAFCFAGTFSVPIKAFEEVDDRYIPTGALRPLSPREAGFAEGHSRDAERISGFFTASGDTAMIDGTCYRVSEHFDRFVLFQPTADADFLCVEPLAGNVNGLARQGEHRVLSPGECAEFKTAILPFFTNF